MRSALAAAIAVGAIGVATAGVAAESSDATGEPRLPTVVNAPGAWSEEEYDTGPVAAVGLATRTRPVGLFDERENLSYFATSALDGSSSWLKLPGFASERWGFMGGVAVSPDGRWLGWVRTGKRQGAIAGWSVLDTTTGQVRNLAVEGFDRVRPTMSDLAFSGDSRHLITSFETPDRPRHGTRGHQFVAWSVTDGTPTVLEQPGFYWLPSLGHADNSIVWSRSHKVFRADPDTGEKTTLTLPRDVLMASWAPDDAAFAYIGRDDRQNGDPPPDEHLYVGAKSSGPLREVTLPESSPIGEALAWRDETHVLVGNFRRDMYVVDITDGSFETIDMAGAGEQINTPTLATGLWAKPLRSPAAPTWTTDPRRPWKWAGLGLFIALLGAGAWLLRHATLAAEYRTITASLDDTRESPHLEARPAVGGVPPAAWAMAWLFLASQFVALVARGSNPADLPWVVASMVLTALVVRWFADGVLRARSVRLVLVWILLSLSTCLGLVELQVGTAAGDAAELLALAFSVAQLVALGAFVTTDYFKDRRSRPGVPRATLAPLLMIAIATGLLGGLTAPQVGEATPMQLRIGL